MVISQSCGLTSVSSGLALLLGEKENSVRQRIREWYYAKEDKRGEGRCEIEVSRSFPISRGNSKRLDSHCYGRPWFICKLAMGGD